MSWERELQDLVRRRIGSRVDLGAAAGSFGARLRRLVEDRVRRLGLDGPERYVALIRAGGEEELRLVSALTNPHSWFLRDEAALSELLGTLEEESPSLLWCAGCAGGEEPYSLALLAHERGLRLSIHASDIDHETIAAARRGVYSDYSLRLVSPRRRARFFEKVDAGWRAGPELREPVTFHRHSLTEAALPSPRGVGWSAISCRNVLIYFDAELAHRVYERFARSLSPGAALLTAASDPLPPHGTFATKVTKSAVLHRPMGPGALPRRSGRRPAPVARAEPPPPAAAPPPVQVHSAVERFAIEPGGDFARALEAGHRALAVGNFAGALEAYGRATASEPLRHEPYFLSGIAHRRAGAPEGAIDCLRRALFIEPDCWPAAFLLGGLFEEVREPEQSRRAYQHAQAQIEAGSALSPEIRAAPGVTLDVGKVLEICRAALI